jgi:hypothetical protein
MVIKGPGIPRLGFERRIKIAQPNRSTKSVGQLGQLVLWIEPGRTIGSPDVGLGLICDRRIEASKPQQYDGLPHAFSKNMRAAFGAKTPEFPR